MSTFAQDPPKKRKETKKETSITIIDTITVKKSERAVVDSTAMQQRKQIKELKEQIEKQKK